jgi:hypothetical protein
MLDISTLPQTVLGNLAIPECATVEFDFQAGAWAFACGLLVSDKLVARNISAMRLLGEMHRRHHAHAVPFRNGRTRAWHVLETVSSEGLSETITLSCDCPDA